MIAKLIADGYLDVLLTVLPVLVGIIFKKQWDRDKALRAVAAGIIAAAKTYSGEKVDGVMPEDKAQEAHDAAKQLAGDLLGGSDKLAKILGGDAFVDAQIKQVHNDLQSKGVIK